MDHLPSLGYGHAQVHFYLIKRAKYKPGGFFTIPAGEPWVYQDHEDLLENGLRPEMSKDEANAFLISWLYFGLLAQVLDREIDSNDFFKQGDLLSTKSLNVFLKEWQEQVEGVAESRHNNNVARYIKTSIAFDHARRFISKHCCHDPLDRDDPTVPCDETETLRPPNKLDSRLDPKLALAIAILGETLQHKRPPLRSDFFGQVNRFCSDRSNEERSWGYSVFCRQQMRDNGWCEFEIRRTEATVTEVSTIYCMSRMKPLEPVVKKNHGNCTMRRCVASSTEPKPQTALHLGSCDGINCGADGWDDTKLVECIQQGKTPLVSWTDEEGLEIEAFDLKVDQVVFGALTHAWEDGLLWCGADGRNKNNRHMYRCQIERAHETFKKLLKTQTNFNGRVYFWVNALCLPRYAVVRTESINQFKWIYQKAKAVVIWDRVFLQNRKLASMIEINMRLKQSNWSKRLWTLQEAVLAEDLYVEFSDGVVGTKEIQATRDSARKNLDDDYHHIWKAGHPFRQVIWKLRNDKAHQVPRAWIAVQFLKVTQPADETPILANILGLDVTKLEEITRGPDGVVAAKRMAKFLTMLDQAKGLGIPSGIIFVPGPKLLMPGVDETRGLGWAPRTWLSRQTHFYPLTRPVRQAGLIGAHGLVVEFPGMTLDCAGVPPESELFWLPVDQGMHKWVEVVVDYAEKATDWKGFWETRICTKSELSIIMCTDRPTDRWDIGVLAQTKGYLTQGEIKWVKVICRVWFRREANTNVIREKANGFRRAEGSLMFGVRHKMLKWCVDGTEE